MSTDTETQQTVLQTRKGRIGKIVRWAARLTSIPILALLLIPLIPAVANFGVAAKDDRIIAVGLCCTCLGFLVGWRWAGIGGLVALLGVGVMLGQEEGPISADPFSVAFGLQGILFLISWALNASASTGENQRPTSRGILWLKGLAAGVLVVAAGAGAWVIWLGPPPTPVPKEREPYVGTWESGDGFRMQITTEGRARITIEKDAKMAPCNAPMPPGESGEFLAEFHDNRLELSEGVLGEKKTYQIDRRPFTRRNVTRMVLNGSDPYSRTNGMLLVKKQGTDTAATRPAERSPTRRRPK